MNTLVEGKVLVIGSGPVMIGQGCEFDFTTTHACLALQQHGIPFVLINPSASSLSTAGGFFENVYRYRATVDNIRRVLNEHKDIKHVLATVGGQAGLDALRDMEDTGLLAEHGITPLGLDVGTLRRVNRRSILLDLVGKLGCCSLPKGQGFRMFDESVVKYARDELTFPVIVRPSDSLGGIGAGVAWRAGDLERRFKIALEPTQDKSLEVRVEQFQPGWKEVEVVMMRDRAGDVEVIAIVECIDPLGIHTGDSISVSPPITLRPKTVEKLIQTSRQILSAEWMNLETCGCNLQFAVNPQDAEEVVLFEINPRVSRIASVVAKGTGIPIPKVAALLGVGYTLAELGLKNFDPITPHFTVKTPTWAVERPERSGTGGPKDEKPEEAVALRLGIQMQSIGEAIGFGFSFEEALMTCLNSLCPTDAIRDYLRDELPDAPEELKPLMDYRGERQAGPQPLIDNLSEKVFGPVWYRIFAVLHALRNGIIPEEEISELTKIDGEVVQRLSGLVALEKTLSEDWGKPAGSDTLLEAKRFGFSDATIAKLLDIEEREVRQKRADAGIAATVYEIPTLVTDKLRDSSARCAFLSYADPAPAGAHSALKPEKMASEQLSDTLLVLGGGPIRQGYGIENDSFAMLATGELRVLGQKIIYLNCHSETTASDRQFADILVLAPLSTESVHCLAKCGVPARIVAQLGGGFARCIGEELLHEEGTQWSLVGIPGHDAAALKRLAWPFVQEVLKKKRLPFIRRCHFRLDADPQEFDNLRYPVRTQETPGGQEVRTFVNESSLRTWMKKKNLVAVTVSEFPESLPRFSLVAVSDGKNLTEPAIVQYIEEVRVNPADSAFVYPAITIRDTSQTIPGSTGAAEESVESHVRYAKRVFKEIGQEIGIAGYYSMKFVIWNDQVEALHFSIDDAREALVIGKVSKLEYPQMLARVLMNVPPGDFPLPEGGPFVVSEAVLPFSQLIQEKVELGVEQKSTGHVVGLGQTFSQAFFNAQQNAGRESLDVDRLLKKEIIVTFADADKLEMLPTIALLRECGFRLAATSGTWRFLKECGFDTHQGDQVVIREIARNDRTADEGVPGIEECFELDEIGLLISTPTGRDLQVPEARMRRAAIRNGVPIFTTKPAIAALTTALALALHRREEKLIRLE